MTHHGQAGSALFSPIFASAAVGRILSDSQLVGAMLAFEAALAWSAAEAGLIPENAAHQIDAVCDPGLYVVEEIGRAAAASGSIAIPLVQALTAQVPEAARGFVHWGATSQDVIDTAFMLASLRALAEMRADLRRGMAALAKLTEAHRRTLMAGRTLLQQALPISFGYKAAIWLSGLTGAARRLREAEANAIALQFGGAAGTLAALGEAGPAVRKALAARLGLSEAPVTWQAERGRILDLAAALAGVSGSCAKIATDILLLMQNEIGEALEPAGEGRGGSSAMPHKRNPVGAVAIRANHRRIAGLVATIVMAQEGEHERAAGGWAAEWETMRDLFCLSAGALERLVAIVSELEVIPERMRANLDSSLGLTQAESLMMALAPKLGRDAAKRRVETAVKRVAAEGRPLLDAAAADPAISNALDRSGIEAALDPANCLGAADGIIDAALAAAQAEMEKE